MPRAQFQCDELLGRRESNYTVVQARDLEVLQLQLLRDCVYWVCPLRPNAKLALLELVQDSYEVGRLTPPLAASFLRLTPIQTVHLHDTSVFTSTISYIRCSDRGTPMAFILQQRGYLHILEGSRLPSMRPSFEIIRGKNSSLLVVDCHQRCRRIKGGYQSEFQTDTHILACSDHPGSGL